MTFGRPDRATLDAVEHLVYHLDAVGLSQILAKHAISPDLLLQPGNMPLLHAAIDAEVERGINGPQPYEATGAVVEVLLGMGADPQVRYLGWTARESAKTLGLKVVVNLIDTALERDHESVSVHLFQISHLTVLAHLADQI